jgi:hypothetical protein
LTLDESSLNHPRIIDRPGKDNPTVDDFAGTLRRLAYNCELSLPIGMQAQTMRRPRRDADCLNAAFACTDLSASFTERLHETLEILSDRSAC